MEVCMGTLHGSLTFLVMQLSGSTDDLSQLILTPWTFQIPSVSGEIKLADPT